jgi:hypothetical protein
MVPDRLWYCIDCVVNECQKVLHLLTRCGEYSTIHQQIKEGDRILNLQRSVIKSFQATAKEADSDVFSLFPPNSSTG